MNERLPQRDVVLLGAGHTNLHVVRMRRMQPPGDVRLTCISDFHTATYSGMLPGTLAGLYPPERMQIDLVRFCAASGVRFIRGDVRGLDVAQHLVLFHDRPPVRFDVLSVGIGSVPAIDDGTRQDDAVLAVKPMQTFLDRLDRRLVEIAPRAAERPLRIAIVGGGAAGIEISFCLPPRVHSVRGDVGMELTLLDRGEELAPGLNRRAVALAERELRARGVRIMLGQDVESVRDGQLHFADGRREPVDVAIWVTSARPPKLLSALGLPQDEQGFLLTRPTLQTVADAPIFVVGDTGTIASSPTPKAGVYAVRQGPILWENIRRTITGRPLVEYEPQSGFLSLLASGDRRAILSYKGFAWHGAWCWRLKDYIDGRFIERYQDYRPMEMSDTPAGAEPMRCAGCGGKVAGSVLARVLGRLEVPQSEHVILGLEAPDDAAIVRPVEGRPMMWTADFFAAPLDDPYLVGRIAAVNAASDVYALGGSPQAALALATLPVGPADQQEELLYQLLAGALEELRRMGATLVGGHTLEGPRTMIGFTLLADPGTGCPMTKSGLRAGDRLVLTKPLGSGALLAAHGQARCRADWMQPLVETMLASNGPAAALAREHGVRGMTDVTGFGLAGHLLEMLNASQRAAELELERLPLLPGAAEVFAAGIESTLAPANRAAESQITAPPDVSKTPQFAALFDPQTSGGLLLGVGADRLESFLRAFEQATGDTAQVIGRVAPAGDAAARIVVR